jgi:uncharacterized protein (TIGR02996 family)
MENRAFLDAIIADPEDDTRRLVYADWLDEHGASTRAEFIRVQCELARKDKCDPASESLLKREKQFLAKHGAQWSKPVSAIARIHHYRRGFVDAVAVSGRSLLTSGAKLFGLAPIRNVKITRLGSTNARVEDLAKCEVLPRIRGLALQGRLDGEDLHAFLLAPGLKQLTALQVGCLVADHWLDPLFGGRFAHLERLDLDMEGSVLTSSHAETLARARWASSLTHLSLKDHAINVPGAQAIAESIRLKNLRYLNLHHCGVGLRGTQSLVESSNLSRLETLDLRRNRLTDSAARAIAASTKLTSLRELYLGMNEIGSDGALALAEWPGLAQLRVLHLYSNPIGDEGARALAASPHAANLRRLDVSFTGVTERGIRALQESPYLSQVQIGSFKGERAVEMFGSPG